MASRSTEGLYVTLVNGVQYLSDYFNYTGKENILSEIKVKTLNTRMIEGFYGHVTEKNPGNNPTFPQFPKRVATEAFHFVIPVVTSGSTMCRKQCGQCSNRDMNIASVLSFVKKAVVHWDNGVLSGLYEHAWM